jgi:hypothetical protein
VGDAEGIANGVLGLMMNTPEDLALLGARCRARIAENYEIGCVVARYADLYKKLYEQREFYTSGRERQ